MMPSEFLCPGCQRLCNIVIPVLPSLHSLIPTSKHKRETFEAWLKNTIAILSDKVSHKHSFLLTASVKIILPFSPLILGPIS